MATNVRFAYGLVLGMLLFALPASAQTGVLRGRVTDGTEPVSGALVQISGSDLSATTDGNGKYIFQSVPVGAYRVRFSQIGYGTTELPVAIVAGTVTANPVIMKEWRVVAMEHVISIPVVTEPMAPEPGKATITGKIWDAGNHQPLSRAQIDLRFAYVDADSMRHSGCCYSTLADSSGVYAFNNQPPGSHYLSVEAAGYERESATVETAADSLHTVDFQLTPVEADK